MKNTLETGGENSYFNTSLLTVRDFGLKIDFGSSWHDIGGESKNTLETSGEESRKYTRDEWGRYKNTLETSGEESRKYTRDEWGRYKNTLETSGEDTKTHSKRVGKIQKHTRNGER